MKTFSRSLFSFCALALFTAAAFGQGSLTPPGPPAPTMKTLDQIEARTPIPGPVVGLVPPFVISQSGSYYLTGKIAVTSGNAIQISADGVTLDLNGFTISSNASPAGGIAIDVMSGSNITIRNGFISGTTTVSGSTFSGGGFSSGIKDSVTGSTNVTVERISVQGIGGDGILLLGASGTVVRSCSTSVTSSRAIYADVILDSIAESAAGFVSDFAMTGGTVSRCSATNISNSTRTGAIQATLCTDSTGTAAGGTGIAATNAVNCIGRSGNTSGTASAFTSSGTATGCQGVGGGGASSIAFGANIAIGCTFSGGTASITNRYNMP